MNIDLYSEEEQLGEKRILCGYCGVVKRRSESVGVLDDEVPALKNNIVNNLLDVACGRGKEDNRLVHIVFASEEALCGSGEELHEGSIAVYRSVQKSGLAVTWIQGAAIEVGSQELRKAAVGTDEGSKVGELEMLAHEYDKVKRERKVSFY